MLSHLLRQKRVISGWHTNDDLRNCYDRCLAWNFKSCLGWASWTHLLLPGIFKRFRENICEDIKLKPIAPWRYVKVHWFFYDVLGNHYILSYRYGEPLVIWVDVSKLSVIITANIKLKKTWKTTAFLYR